jgi:hypothetical protein
MKYYEKVLQPDEKVKYVGSLHWTIYTRAILFATLIALIAWGTIWMFDLIPNKALVIAFFACLAVVPFFDPWLVRTTTEIVVTDKRIIHKVGLIARQTEEMNISKIETVEVEQRIFGRILDYGTVLIIGVGASWEPLKFVASPLKLRNAIIVG